MKAQFQFELSWSSLNQSIEMGDRSIFEYARAGMIAVCVCMPLSIYTNYLVGDPQGDFIFHNLLRYVPIACGISLWLVFQKRRYHLLLSYLFIYIFISAMWWCTYNFADLRFDNTNYYIWLPITATSYFAAVGVFAYFPLLTFATALASATSIIVMAVLYDPTAMKQFPAFCFFIMMTLSDMALLFLLRRSFMRLSFEIENSTTREKTLKQTQSLLQICLEETRLGLIGFDEMGDCIVKMGYFPADPTKKEPANDAYQFKGNFSFTSMEAYLSERFSLSLTEPDQLPIQFKHDDRHFLIDLHCGSKISVFTSIDVTESERREELMRNAQKLSLIGELTSGITHDYNNILAIALSNVEAFPADQYPDLQKEYIEPTKNALYHAKSVSRKLLTLAGRRKLDLKYVEVTKALNDSQEIFSSALGSAIGFEMDIEDDAIVKTDVEELKAAVLNLLINAKNILKGRPKPRVRLTVRVLAGNLQIWVDDNGPGFGELQSDRLFDPFFTTKAGKYSTGLGLSMVKGFVEQNQGSVHAERVEGWTRFVIQLPIVAATKAIINSLQKPAISPSLVNHQSIPKVLLIDDNEELAVSIQRLMKVYKIEALIAATREEAHLAIARNPDIGVVLIDYSMPEITGLELGGELMNKHPRARYFIHTGEVPDSLQKEAIEMGFENVISKPVKMNELIEILAIPEVPQSQICG